MGAQAGLVFLVLASGFVAAGLLNALHALIWVKEEESDYSPMMLRFESPLSSLWSCFVCVFAGPFLVIVNGYHFWRLNFLPTPALALCGFVSLIWSFCSGVVIVESILLASRLMA